MKIIARLLAQYLHTHPRGIYERIQHHSPAAEDAGHRARQWIKFLADFTKENRGAHATLEVLGIDEIKHGVETEDRVFSGVSADVKDRESTVWITLGDLPDRHLTQGIHNVTAIRAVPPSEKQGAVLEVETADGTRTLLELTRPEAFALSPAT